ncbi:hypothetical protein PG990_006751 [Apiospora arundinis]
MGAQQSQMVNEDDEHSRSSKRDSSPFSHAADGDYSDRDDNNHDDIDSSQREKPVFSSQIPASARRDRELGKMNSSKSKKRRSRRSSDPSQELPPHSSQDFEPPFVKHESNMIQEDEDEDQDTVAQIKGDPGADDEPGPVIEDEEFGAEILEKAKRERRERKELKKARRAEKMRLSQLKGDPEAMDETDSHDTSQVNGVSPEAHRTNGFVAVNHQVPASPEVVEASKPSKRRKRLPVAKPVAAEDPIQSSENGELSRLALLASSANDTVVPTSSPLKRKGRDSSNKKQRKKQKQQAEDVEEEDEGTAGMSVPFADAAQDIYAERYNEAQSSPSAARLQRRSQSRAESPEPEQSDTEMAQPMQHDQVSQSAEDEIVPQTMDLDEDNDVDLPVDNHYAERDASEASNNEIENHLGSDDLGVAEPMEVDHEASDSAINGNAAPTPASNGRASGSSPGLAMRQYGSKAGTGRKRHVKAPFNEAEQGEEDNRQAFEQLPAASPSATAAKKRRKKDNADAGRSSAAKGKGSKKGGGSKAPRKVQDPPKGEENTGPFTEEELSNIDKALKHWQEDHDLTDHARNELIHMNPQSPKAKASYSMELWDAVQAVVPGRKRQKIISQCRRKYHNFSARGAWTPEQHQELVQLFNQYGNKYAEIGKEMNRYAEDVRDRIRNYVVCGDAQNKATWSPEEQLNLSQIIKKSLEVIRASETFQAPDNRKKEEELIDWQAVSESMGRTRSRLQCQMKWKKIKASIDDEEEFGDVSRKEPIDQIIQRAREEAVKIPAQDLSKIAKRIKDTKATKHNRIPWSRVHAGGVATKYSRPVLIVAWCRMRLLVPEWEMLTPGDIAVALRAKYQEDGDLQLPTNINMEQEYMGLEHMIGIIRGNYDRRKDRRKAMSAALVLNDGTTKNDGNSDGEEGQEPTYYDTSEDEAQQASDADMGAAHDTPEAEAQQVSDADMGVAPSSTAKIPNDREIEESDLEEAAPAPPASSSKAKGSSRKAKGKGKEKEPTVSSTAASRRRSTKTPKGKGKGKGKAARSQSIVEDDEQSSDTDADEVEDIPAKTPNSKAKPKPKAKSKAKAKAARAQPVVEEEEQSSDTDADEVEDIPARRY